MRTYQCGLRIIRNSVHGTYKIKPVVGSNKLSYKKPSEIDIKSKNQLQALLYESPRRWVDIESSQKAVEYFTRRDRSIP